MRDEDPDEPIPSAPFDDLDLSDPAQFAIWEKRVLKVGAFRRRVARERLIVMGVIREDGSLVSTDLPPDMLPTSKTSLETG